MKNKLILLVLTLVAAAALGGPIKNWSAGEYITAADLNAALNHLHTNLGHGHGPVIINADISGSAAIAHSKMASPGLLPKAWATIGAACGASPCTITDSQVVTSITRSSAGVYVVNFPTRSDANYAAFITSNTLATTCKVTARATTNATVSCLDDATAATPTDSSFSFFILDSGN